MKIEVERHNNSIVFSDLKSGFYNILGGTDILKVSLGFDCKKKYYEIIYASEGYSSGILTDEDIVTDAEFSYLLNRQYTIFTGNITFKV